jgi:TonB family protein
MNRLVAASLLIFFGLFVHLPTLLAQQEQTEGTRKIVNRVTPRYPEMARSIHLSGSVKAEAVVEPNGSVKAVDVKGGNPVLVREAQAAIYKWKWVPAAHETREPIEVKFSPQ